jgi:GT2 family glycosyltransferase
MNPGHDAPHQTATAVSVVIASWCRPHYVRSCLERLCALSPGPQEIVVVDASPDRRTRSVVSDFPGVVYVSFPGGAGHMTTSRNVGLLHVSGDVIAFLDDDTVVHDAWLEGVVATFADLEVGALAGRTCNGHPGEESEGVADIGRLLPDGRLTGFFAADPGRPLDVAHGIGANMAFRRQVLAQLGGFRDDFLGVGGVREDTDVFFRTGALGYRIVFSPDASVDHLGAPHVRGRRFDFRYVFWSRRNHALLLARNFGMGSNYFRSWLRDEIVRAVTAHHSNPLRRFVRILLGIGGIAGGVLSAALKASWRSSDPRRSDDVGNRIRNHLLGGQVISNQ